MMTGMNKLLLLAFVVCLMMPVSAFANYLTAQKLRAERVAGPFAYPWSLAFLPDGAFLVTEKPGRLKLVQHGQHSKSVPKVIPKAIQGVPQVQYSNQGGLMDVVLAPDFAESKVLYLSYSFRDGAKISVRVLRAKLDRSGLRLVDPLVIFQSRPAARGNKHLGGRMVVTQDGFLFLSLGERGDKPRAQDLSDHAGSIIRIHADGRIPDDNPFVGQTNARPEIWAYGNRNPQGLAQDPLTGEIWTNEHGPRGGDELNKITRGQNYGWPLVSYGVNYIGTPVGAGKATAPGITPPAHYWVPSIATSGLAIVREGEQISFWNGGLVGRTLARVIKAADGSMTETRFLDKQIGRIRDVRYGPDGYLYVLTDASRGYLYRLHPE